MSNTDEFMKAYKEGEKIANLQAEVDRKDSLLREVYNERIVFMADDNLKLKLQQELKTKE